MRWLTGTSASGMSCGLTDTTFHRPLPLRSSSTWVTLSDWAQKLGWVKWVRPMTESRSSLWLWPTTTRSGASASRASAPASFSGPIPVVS